MDPAKMLRDAMVGANKEYAKPPKRFRGNREPTWRYFTRVQDGGELCDLWIPSVSEVLGDLGLSQDVVGIELVKLRKKSLVASVTHLAMGHEVLGNTEHNFDEYARGIVNAEPEKYEGIPFERSKAEAYFENGRAWWQAHLSAEYPQVIAVENRGVFGLLVAGTSDVVVWYPKTQRYGIIDWKTTSVAKIPDYYGYQLAGYVIVAMSTPDIPVSPTLDPTGFERRIVLLRADDKATLTRTNFDKEDPFPPSDFVTFNQAVELWHEREKYNKKGRLLRPVGGQSCPQ